MCNRETDIFSDVDRGQQSAILVTRWAGATLLAGEGNEPGTMLSWSLFTVGAANSSKTFMQIATLEIGCQTIVSE